MKNNNLLSLILLLLSSVTAYCQTYQNVTLISSTPVFMEVASAFSSDEITVGQAVKLTVKNAIVVEGATVVRNHAKAMGRVKKIQASSFNYPAIVTIEAVSVQTADDKFIDVEGEVSFKGIYNGEGVKVEIGSEVNAVTNQSVGVRGVRLN